MYLILYYINFSKFLIENEGKNDNHKNDSVATSFFNYKILSSLTSFVDCNDKHCFQIHN